MSKIKNGGLDQYGAKPSEQRQFGTTDVEWVNSVFWKFNLWRHCHLFGSRKVDHWTSLEVNSSKCVALTHWWKRLFNN